MGDITKYNGVLHSYYTAIYFSNLQSFVVTIYGSTEMSIKVFLINYIAYKVSLVIILYNDYHKFGENY